MFILSRFSYYFKRVKESPLDKTINIFFLKFKKVFFVFVYQKQIYNFFFKPKIKKKYFKEFTLYKNQVQQRFDALNIKKTNQEIIENLDDGYFQCLGYGNVDLENFNWNTDPFHDYKWESCYFNKIDFACLSDRCDVKVPWEISRLQFLLNLAVEYNQRKNDTHLIQFNRLLNDWNEKNPVGYGVSWVCTMEVSIRIVNIIISLMFLYDYLDLKQRAKIYKIILEHYIFIKRFPEISDVPGNHYLSNLMGAYICSFVINGKKHKETRKHFSEFLIEANNQFDVDGCHFEKATIYHRLCLEFVALVISFESKLDHDEGLELYEIYLNGIRFCELISSNHKLPIFGDSDSGHVIWLGNDCRDFEYLKQPFHIHSGNEIKALSPEAGILLALYQCNNSLNKLEQNTSNFVGNLSGFTIIKKHSFNLMVRYGEQGMKGRASHDHDDAQNIWLSYNGADILIDNGCNGYSLDKAMRICDIVSSAHNGMKVIGTERTQQSLGSVMSSVRGAMICSEPEIEESESEVFVKSKLLIDNPNIIKSLARNITTKFLECGVNIEVQDVWNLIDEKGVEINWRFNTEIIQDAIISESHYISFLIKELNLSFTVEASCPICYEIFEFRFGHPYGNSVLKSGIRVKSTKSQSGWIKTSFKLTF